MHVIATAGHVDHGKSTLVRMLTGMEPDRWAEERRRGLTIDLGFAWTADLAFVDVPGHERFVPNTLAGIGPVPAVMLVVAADEGWMPQTAEHVAALNALGVRHGLVVITKADRASPSSATTQALHELSDTTLAGSPAVAVSHDGSGLPELRSALASMTSRLPAPDVDGDVRLWIDRAFTIRGAGTVVTGTLTAGTLHIGDELQLSSGARVHVRGLQSLGSPHSFLGAVARVAVNLRGKDTVRRGDALLTPGAWLTSSEVDVALRSAGKLHRELVLHIGSAAVPVHVRPLGTSFARLTLASPLPLRIGDRGLLRDPGAHRIAAGFDVLDVRPPSLSRRGAARLRVEELAADSFLGKRFIAVTEARAMGWAAIGHRVGDWLVSDEHWKTLASQAQSSVTAWLDAHPLAAGMPAETLRQALDLPSLDLVEPLLDRPLTNGIVPRAAETLPQPVESAIRKIEQALRENPFQAPEADDLRALGLGRKELAAATRLGRLTTIADGITLGPDPYPQALEILATLPQPFTVSDARRALNTTRRVAIPLLETLDTLGHTHPLPDGRRQLT
ncbi:SelB C-terminal domain-containing protein [Actinocrispum sp. NPDC049592]|uniref:selenocysteine-specific translation elongation factor n=1 Tax=Actinocrispum sp. NPDC049592 TaxID=3154835 RepID=UPI003440278C